MDILLKRTGMLRARRRVGVWWQRVLRPVRPSGLRLRAFDELWEGIVRAPHTHAWWHGRGRSAIKMRLRLPSHYRQDRYWVRRFSGYAAVGIVIALGGAWVSVDAGTCSAADATVRWLKVVHAIWNTASRVGRRTWAAADSLATSGRHSTAMSLP